MRKICKKCGVGNDKDALNCCNCGFPLTDDVEVIKAYVKTIPVNETKPPRSNKYLVTLLCLCSAMILINLLLGFLMPEYLNENPFESWNLENKTYSDNSFSFTYPGYDFIFNLYENTVTVRGVTEEIQIQNQSTNQALVDAATIKSPNGEDVINKTVKDIKVDDQAAKQIKYYNDSAKLYQINTVFVKNNKAYYLSYTGSKDSSKGLDSILNTFKAV